MGQTPGFCVWANERPKGPELRVETIVESEVVELLARADICPVCSARSKAVDGWIYGAFYNLLHNEDARFRLKSGGLCREHSRRIVEMAREKSDIGSLPVSVVFKELLFGQLNLIGPGERKLFKRVSSSRNTGGCHLCEVSRESEKRYVIAIAKFFDSEKIRKLYEESSSILCIDHAREVAASMRAATVEWFVTLQKSKIESVIEMLERYIGKNDYRNTSPIGEERNAWLTASRIIGETRVTGRNE